MSTPARSAKWLARREAIVDTSAEVFARFMLSRAGSHPQGSNPCHRSDTGPVWRAGAGNTSSTIGPFRDDRTVNATSCAPRTRMTSRRSFAGSHLPSNRKQPGWAASVFS